jgi:hypothetical protein
MTAGEMAVFQDIANQLSGIKEELQRLNEDKE